MPEEMKQVPIDLSHVFELLSNKKNDILDIDYSNDNDSYPTVRAVKNYVDDLQTILDSKASIDSVNNLGSALSSNLNTIYSFINHVTTDKVYDKGNLTNIGTTPHSTQELVNSKIDSQLGTIDSQLGTIDSQLGTIDSQLGNNSFFIVNNIDLSEKRRVYQIDLTFDQFQELDSCYIKVPTYETSTKYNTFLKFKYNEVVPFIENSAQLRENEANGYLLKVQYDNNQGIIVLDKLLIDEDKFIPSFFDLSKNFDLSELELIDSTHSLASTFNWTGTSTRLTSLTKGTRILYRITYVPTARGQGATLSIQFTDKTYSEYKAITFADGTRSYAKWFTSSIAKNDVLLLEYDGTHWVLLDFFAIGERPQVARTGSYNDLSDKPTIPTIPTNVSAFNNDSGYLTSHQDISGKENTSNKVTSLSSSSTDTQYPSAKCVYDTVDIVDDKVSVVYNPVSIIDTSDSVYDADRWTENGTMSIGQQSNRKFIAGGGGGYVIYDGNISNLDNYDITLNLTTSKKNTHVYINDNDIGTLPTSQTSILFKKRDGVVKVVYDNNQYDASAVQIISFYVMNQIRYTIDVVLYQGMIYDVIDSIPSKTSDLTNDSNFLTSHQDISGKEDKSNKVTFLSSSSTDTQYPSAKAVYDAVNGFYTDLYDVMDCINVNFNNLDNIYLLDTVFNISNYNGLPSKNSSVVNDILRNNAVSGISLNKEFTPSTNYTLKFDYYTSVSNRNGFYFGTDPLLEDGVSINNSNDGLQILVDVSNTLVETFNGTSSPTNVYTHTSNLFTSGTHHIRIVRNNTNVTFYIDDVELYTYTNAKYNTIGLNKWGGGYNTISNIEIKIGD